MPGNPPGSGPAGNGPAGSDPGGSDPPGDGPGGSDPPGDGPGGSDPPGDDPSVNNPNMDLSDDPSNVKKAMSEPYTCNFGVLSDEEQNDLDQRVTIYVEDVKDWIDSDHGQSYHGQVDLILTDPPWGVLYDTKGDRLRSDIKLYRSDIPRICDYVARALTNSGTVLLRTSIQEWHVWAEAFTKSHLTVEKVPLVVAKHPSACAQVQTRWQGRTSSCFFYVIAHKKSKDFFWQREKSGFLVRNMYGHAANLMTGINPPRKSERLKDHKNAVIRPQVSESLFGDLVDSCMYIGDGSE